MSEETTNQRGLAQGWQPRSAGLQAAVHKPGFLAFSLAMLSLALLGIALSLLLGHPLFGKPWFSWLSMGSILVTMVTLSVTSAEPKHKLTDLRMLLPEEHLHAVKDVMYVRLASQEDGIHSYRGYLLTAADQAYEHLDRNLGSKGALVLLQPDDRMQAEVTVVPKSRRPDLKKPPVRWGLHVMLFGVTMVTATLAGALHQGINPLDSGTQWTVGLPYAFALLTILGIHEAGHYAVARLYRMDVTPPFFIPAPLPLGTFGAVISMRSPSKNRRIMFDTAAAGPLLGLVSAIVFLAIGLALSKPRESVFSSELLAPKPGSSLLFTLVAAMANPALKYGANLDLHPFAFAGWLGLLITAINLIPVGQLDGGHMAHAMFGRKVGDAISFIALVTLLGLALFVWPSLLIFAVLLMFMAYRSERALDGITPLGAGRTIIGVFSLFCLVAILIPVPQAMFNWMMSP